MNRQDWYVLGIALLLVVACGYRLYELDHDSFWIDESYTVVAAQAVTEHGVPLLDSERTYWRAWPQTYVLAGIGIVAGFGHVPMRVLSVIAGVGLIAIAFFLLRSFYGDTVAFLTSAILTFSYGQVAWSRQARMYMLLELCVLVALWSYLRWRETHDWHHFFLTLGVIIVGALLHAAALLLPLAFLLHLLLVERPHPRALVAQFFQKHALPRWVVISVVGATALGLMFFAFRYVPILRMVNYADEYRWFLIGSQYVLLFLAAIGAFADPKKWKSNALFLFFGVLLFSVAAFFVLLQNPRYLLVLVPIIALFAAQGIVYVCTAYSSTLYRWMSALGILTLLVASGFFFFPQSSYPLETDTPQPPFASAYEFLAPQLSATDQLLVTQPAIAKLYLRKPDAWVAFSYTNLPMERENIVDASGRELYVGVPSILNVAALEQYFQRPGYLVIDDMGLQRMDPQRRALIEQQQLMATFGDRYWSRVYVYHFPDG